jgi:hypothetical protein
MQVALHLHFDKLRRDERLYLYRSDQHHDRDRNLDRDLEVVAPSPFLAFDMGRSGF